MNDEKILTLEDIRTFLESHSGAILYFYNDNCYPCLALRPKLSELIENEFPEMNLLWLNTGKGSQATASYNVFASPAIIVFFEGKEFRRYSKYISIDELRADLARPYYLLFGE